MNTPSWTQVTFWVAAAACLLAQLAIVRSVFVARPPADASAGAAAAGAAPRRPGEVAWAILPAVALAAVLVFTWRAMHAPADPSMPAAAAGIVAPAGVTS